MLDTIYCLSTGNATMKKSGEPLHIPALQKVSDMFSWVTWPYVIPGDLVSLFCSPQESGTSQRRTLLQKMKQRDQQVNHRPTSGNEKGNGVEGDTTEGEKGGENHGPKPNLCTQTIKLK